LKKKKFFWRVNSNITAPELRLIDKDGKQIGVVSRNEALALAKKAELDLVEIVPLAKPPVAKIIDFGKHRYQEEKKLKAQKKKAKGGELKEVRFSPFIAEGDYQTRIKRVQEFLDEGNKVRIVIVFKGRQMGSKQFGYKLLTKIVEYFGESIAVDMEPKFLGRHLVMIISPLRKIKKQEPYRNQDEKDKIKNEKVGSKKI
jgi:translation initiation factor IF-3